MNLNDKIKSCTRCHLYLDLPCGAIPVHGDGNQDANVMLLGEALGENEVILGQPFQGMAGKLLDKMLKTAGIKRESLYITNVVKCRPTKNNGRSNRPPTKEEIQKCKPWLWAEIKKVNPKVIITLGKIPTTTLLAGQAGFKKSSSLASILGQPFSVDYHSAKIVPCYHPSYLMQHGRDKINDCIKIIGDEYYGIN